MTIVWIRVISGFLAGIAAGIIIMREIYKKRELKAAGREMGEAGTRARELEEVHR